MVSFRRVGGVRLFFAPILFLPILIVPILNEGRGHQEQKAAARQGML
jgi:hypothetical protein